MIGFGSIGARHARILSEFGHQVSVVSSRPNSEFECFSSVSDLLESISPDYVVIASPTSQHFNDLTKLSEHNFGGKILIEKPLFHAPMIIPHLATESVAVGYNLRFHPLVERLRQVLTDLDTLTNASLHAGQLLSEWRPGRDYRETSSARQSTGGGVLRDLSHELDLAFYLFGNMNVTSVQSSLSGLLDIDGPDNIDISCSTDSGSEVAITLNYLDKPAQRIISVTINDIEYKADLVNRSLEVDGVVSHIDITRDESYRRMHQSILCGDMSRCATVEDGLRIVQFIDQIERRLPRDAT